MQTDKDIARKDWRVRPLPADMLKYARMDTHYLLYIADIMRQRLIAAGDTVVEEQRVPVPPEGPQVRAVLAVHVHSATVPRAAEQLLSSSVGQQDSHAGACSCRLLLLLRAVAPANSLI